MSLPLLDVQKVSQTFSGKTIFHEVSLAIREGDRIGLIGPNGSGKSTLMQVLAGRWEADEGMVVRRRDLRVAYVTQSPEFDLDLGILRSVEQALEKCGLSDTERNVRAMIWLSQCGFEDIERPIKELSGGWRKRLQVIAAIAQEADIVLLDEPTNHLDMKGVEWLEEILSQQVKTWMAISHDRYFLDNTVSRIAELDSVYAEGIFSVDGSYGEFLRRKDEFLTAQSQYADSLASKVRREDAWLARGPKARSTKAKGRIDQAYELKAELNQVRGRMKTESTDIQFSTSGRKTKKLIELTEVYKSLGDKTLVSGLDYVMRPGKVLGILGDNGSGKTTLLQLLSGALLPDAGTVVHAIDLNLVYFDQHRESLDPTWTLKRALSDSGDSVVYQDRSIHIVSWAKRFRFRPDQLDIPVAELSGGEKARVVIARLMLRKADVLLLDEPTNDLDIPTLEILEDSLAEFPGAIALVTHDRFMLKSLCDEYLGFDGQGNVKSFASFDQWSVDHKQAAKGAKAASAKEANAAKKTTASSSKKLSYKEQREYDGMEEKILHAEEALAGWETKVADPALATQSSKLQEACDALEKARHVVQSLYDRWSELEAKVEGR